MRAEHCICYLYRGQTSYQKELLLTYGEDSMRIKINYVAMKEMSCVHYIVDNQDYGYRSGDDHDLLDSENTLMMEEQHTVKHELKYKEHFMMLTN